MMCFRSVQYYTFVIRVERADGAVHTIFRRYSEFNEFNAKLMSESTHKLPAFPSKIYVGRSAIRQVCWRVEEGCERGRDGGWFVRPSYSNVWTPSTLYCRWHRSA